MADNYGYQSKDYTEQAKQYKQQEDLYGKEMQALQAQDLAEQAIPKQYETSLSAQQQAYKSAQDTLRAQAAKALAANQGSLGGGRGIAVMRQSAQSQGLAAGTLAGQYSQQQADLLKQQAQAQADAAGAHSQLLGEQNKLIQAHAAQQQEVGKKVADAKNIIDTEKGTIYTTKEEKDKIAQHIREQTLAGVTNPAVIQAVENLIAQMYQDTSGTIDVG